MREAYSSLKVVYAFTFSRSRITLPVPVRLGRAINIFDR
jgi:hypothetical protein